MSSIHDRQKLLAWGRNRRVDPGRLRLLRNAFYKQQAPPERAIDCLPADCRDAFAAEVQMHSLALESRHDSNRDGATRLVFHTAAGEPLETVILRLASGRTSLCVSSQVGCAARCQFCATGYMGKAINLQAAEILDQVIQANLLLATEDRSVRNIVFMGMGEPFHSEASLYEAIDVLCDRACFHLHPNRLLVSTVGVPEAMVRCARRFPEVRMAVSLHSAREETRQQLMPVARRHGLDSLRNAICEVASITDHEVMIEYLMLDGVNDAFDDAEALIQYVHGIDVHINLIPYNSIAEAPQLAASDKPRQEAFSGRLKAAGLNVTTRYSLGADIAAACGQLARKSSVSIADQSGCT